MTAPDLPPAAPRPRLEVFETCRVLRVARGGRLLPWLGPALRGLAAGRLRARVCRQPVEDQLGRYLRCAGCPLMRGCAYGETVEPDPPAGLHLASGWESAARPLVVAPACPAPELARVGDRCPVRVVFVGPTAAGHADAFWDALRVGGADPQLGLGEDRVLFDVLPADAPDRTGAVELPTDPAVVPGMVPAVRVVLTGPLFLNAADGDRKRLVERPTFADLIRAGLRVLGPLHKCYGEPLPDAAFGAVKRLAEGVPTTRAAFAVVGQPKSSHRTGDRWDVRGVAGWAEYGPVPVGLLPWLRWAGRVHVGTHRVAGAGGWRIDGC
jgi:hypothetical protein